MTTAIVEQQYAGTTYVRDTLRLIGRTLSFRVTTEDLLNLNRRDLLVGLFFAWIAGIGRYWDNPKAEFLQKLGVGSVLYVFVLAAFLYAVVWPLRPKNWTYFRVLTFITLTSPPALMYAIPFQMIFPDPGFRTANDINAVLLGIVALWRLGLLYLLLTRLARLSLGARTVAVLLPMVMIIFALTTLNLEKVVFNIMGGITELSPNDGAYEILVFITLFSFFAFPVLLICYVVGIVNAWRSQKGLSDRDVDWERDRAERESIFPHPE